MIRKEDYLKNPCGSLSIPYYKAKWINVPENMKIINSKNIESGKLSFDHHEYIEELYFRLIHKLSNLNEAKLPEGYNLADASADELYSHINSCYENVHISLTELNEFMRSEIYDNELIVALEDAETDKIVATGIAVIDREMNEGVLEWIQVSENYRRKGLGSFIVNYLLQKMAGKADFATVSGKLQNKNNPEKLYRKCGFEGDDVWRILRRK